MTSRMRDQLALARIYGEAGGVSVRKRLVAAVCSRPSMIGTLISRDDMIFF